MQATLSRDTGTGALQLLVFSLATPASSIGLDLRKSGIQGLADGPLGGDKISTKENFMGGNFIEGNQEQEADVRTGTKWDRVMASTKCSKEVFAPRLPQYRRGGEIREQQH